MKRTLITPDIERFPALFHPLLEGAEVYDSSCKPLFCKILKIY